VSIARQNVNHSKTNSACWETKQRDFKAFWYRKGFRNDLGNSWSVFFKFNIAIRGFGNLFFRVFHNRDFLKSGITVVDLVRLYKVQCLYKLRIPLSFSFKCLKLSAVFDWNRRYFVIQTQRKMIDNTIFSR
jgi:hypothetical protein